MTLSDPQVYFYFIKARYVEARGDGIDLNKVVAVSLCIMNNMLEGDRDNK